MSNTTRHRNINDSISSTSSPPKKFNHDDIRRKLALLASIARPLSPTLPLSPPLSPRPLKRKANSDDDSNSSKKPRPAPLPKEDGELDDVSKPIPSPIKAPPHIPKPKRRFTRDQLRSMGASYMAQARVFKRSGDRRTDLHNMPPPTHRNYILRLLEHTDSILHFVYSFWCEDEGKGIYANDSWATLNDFLGSTVNGWEKVASNTPDESVSAGIKVLLGLLYLIRFCANYRLSRKDTRQLRSETHPSVARSPANRNTSASPSNTASSSDPTPPYPSSSNGHLTVQHRPQSVHAPSPASSVSSSTAYRGPSALRDTHHRHATSQSPSTIPQVLVPTEFISRVHKTVVSSYGLHADLIRANQLLNLRSLGLQFPVTYNICIGNNAATGAPLISGSFDDAVQVDIEECGQGRGEWAWPVTNGDDAVHAAGFGRSLLWELAPRLGGYRGTDGCNKDDHGNTLPNGL